jgi:ABC-type nitrate/sulfonate/bicarbonate transport system ATPase subunit
MSHAMVDGRMLLRAKGLRVRRGESDVLHGVDLEVRAGEVLAILGPNGAGKSTLLETLGGILKPSGGQVERAGRVATVMQTPGLARRSAQANVELALAWWKVPRRQRAQRATEALESMHAGHLAGRAAESMSGGERRRVHLARAVALRPDILLLDEPFAGLDPETHAALRDDTASALRTSAGAVVLVVHDRSEAWAMADRLVVMLDGRIAAEGSPKAVLAQPPTADVARFLGYDGELTGSSGLLLTRPANVIVDAAGDLSATVTRVVPVEDGVRVDLRLSNGHLRALVAFPGPGLGDEVRVRVIGGAHYPA